MNKRVYNITEQYELKDNKLGIVKSMFQLYPYFDSIYQPETLAYFAAHPTMTPAEVAALDVEIKGIKSGTPLTLSSLTLNLSLVSGAYFITRSSVDLNRYSGIPGVQFSVAATGTPATTAVFSGAITAGTGETVGSDILVGWDFTSGWSVIGDGSVVDANTFSSLSIGGLNKEFFTVGKLIKRYYDKTTTASTSMFRVSNASGFASPGVADLESGYAYSTVVVQYTYAYTRNADFGSTDVTKLETYPVLTPDSKGILAAALTNGGIAANSATFVVTVSKP